MVVPPRLGAFAQPIQAPHDRGSARLDDPVAPLAPLLFHCHQARSTKDRQVPRHQGLREIEAVNHRSHAAVPSEQAFDDLHSNGMAERGEDRRELA